jgi:hypothetical protein
MIKQCEYKTCSNFFTLGRKTKFCSPRCNLNSAKQAWKKRNAGKVIAGESKRRKKRYEADADYRKKCVSRADQTYQKLSQEQRRQRSQDSRDTRGDDHREYMRSYMARRAATEVAFKLKGVLRARVRAAIANSGGQKSHKTMHLVGCTVQHMRQHLEQQFTEGMSWDNHGDWHIDHIIPCAAFDLSDDQQQLRCFNYTNLQPLWAVDNLSKGDRIEASTLTTAVVWKGVEGCGKATHLHSTTPQRYIYRGVEEV